MAEIKKYLWKLANHKNLDIDETARAFQIMLTGGATPAQTAALLMGLCAKGETIEELIGAAQVMRSRSGKISAPPNAIDTCGTGGDSANIHTLNVSTAVAFVVAACGIPVAKHGNRAISSKSGSADVLSMLGVNVDAGEKIVEQCLEEAGICFMMAPRFHTAMRNVAPVRVEMGMRTIFNLLGPLCNPASTRHHLLGVYASKWVEPMAKVLQELGAESAWVVHGLDGMDELTITGPSYVAELKNNEIHCFEVNPEDAGLEIADIKELEGDTATRNAEALRAMLKGKTGAYRDVVLLNAAAALIVSGKAKDLKEGVAIAAEAVDSGKALHTLEKLVEISNMDKDVA